MLKDIVVKSHVLEGFDSPYVPGWDCHGLPIEHKVETTIGKIGKEFDDANAFRDACRAYAHEQIEIQKAGFKRLGIWAIGITLPDYGAQDRSRYRSYLG